MFLFWISLELRVMEVASGDSWSYKTCKAPVNSSPPTNQHPTYVIQAGCTSCRPTNSVTALKGIIGILFMKIKTRCQRAAKLPYAKIRDFILSIFVKSVVIFLKILPQIKISELNGGMLTVVI